MYIDYVTFPRFPVLFTALAVVVQWMGRTFLLMTFILNHPTAPERQGLGCPGSPPGSF